MSSFYKFLIFLTVWAFDFAILESLENSPIHPKPNQFFVYWNVPSNACIRHKIKFEGILDKFNIKHNAGDKFKGEQIVILYNPGEFPHIKNTSGKKEIINGGVPQKGNIARHLLAFEKNINDSVPENFTGIGVIDFEAWRPICRQNWNKQAAHIRKSYSLAGNNVTGCNNFQAGAKRFMKKTLEKAKNLRPNGVWGYYGFPHCLNEHNKKDVKECADTVNVENDNIQWLFNASTALYPSLYMIQKMPETNKTKFIDGRLKESQRVWINRNKTKNYLVLPYAWYKYKESDTYLSRKDMKMTIEITKNYSMGGLIIWGSSKDVNTTERCQELFDYVKKTLGPLVKKFTSSDKDI